jgi:hypothetical protein
MNENQTITEAENEKNIDSDLSSFLGHEDFSKFYQVTLNF